MTSHVCYEGNCASGPRRVFSSIRGLRQHLEKSHQNTPEDETSLGSSRSLKRKRDEEELEEQQRRDLEARLAWEAASREPEPQPVRLLERAHCKICVDLITSRSRCSTVQSILDFNVRRESGGFLCVFVTLCLSQRRPSHVPWNIVESPNDRYLPSQTRPTSPKEELWTVHAPSQRPIPSGYSGSILLFPPTTHATRTFLPTLIHPWLLPNPLDLA